MILGGCDWILTLKCPWKAKKQQSHLQHQDSGFNLNDDEPGKIKHYDQ